jgi:hypothetical protein
MEPQIAELVRRAEAKRLELVADTPGDAAERIEREHSEIAKQIDFPALRPVGQGGEIKHGTFSETKEQISASAYGIILNLSRQLLVNDQLNSIDQVLGSWGDRVSDWENTTAFEVILANSGMGPTLIDDSKTVFHAAHANIAAVGGTVSVNTVGAGRAAMQKQTTIDGIKANFKPRTLLCGPDIITSVDS